MDAFRRMFGFPDRRSDQETNPFRSPTWEEIMGNRENRNPRQNPDQFGEVYGSPSFPHEPHGPHPMDSMMAQMDMMFQHIDTLMRGLHGHGGQVIITEEPDSDHDSPARQAPRDFMLKEPDGEHQPTLDQPTQGFGNGSSHHFFHGPNYYPEGHDEGHGNGQSWDGFHGFGGFGGFHGGSGGFEDPHGGHNPFSMMENFFHNFEDQFRGVPFGGQGQGPWMGPGPGDGGAPGSGTSMLKEDKDLDDRVTGGLSQLLKEGPTYDNVEPRKGGIMPRSGQLEPQVRFHFHSRIRRPDGSVEETREYRDSSGREEVTVTRSEPQVEGVPGITGPEIKEGAMQPSQLGRLFSWMFTR